MNLSDALRNGINEVKKKEGSIYAIEKKIGATGLGKFLKGESAGINTTTIDKILEVYDIKIQDFIKGNESDSNNEIANSQSAQITYGECVEKVKGLELVLQTQKEEIAFLRKLLDKGQ